MDLKSHARWVEHSISKDEVFKYTDIKRASSYIFEIEDNRRVRLNTTHHLISILYYKELKQRSITLSPIKKGRNYIRFPFEEQNYINQIFENQRSFAIFVFRRLRVLLTI